MLISETHIGNDKIFNQKIIVNGVTKRFQLGDLFKGYRELLGDVVSKNERLKWRKNGFNDDVSKIDII